MSIGGRVDADAVDAAVEPEAQDVVELLATSGCSQLKSGWSGVEQVQVPLPSGTWVQAGPPKMDCQSLGGPPSTPGRNQNRSRAGEPGPAASASWNHGCWSEQWFGTTSMMMRMPRS